MSGVLISSGPHLRDPNSEASECALSSRDGCAAAIATIFSDIIKTDIGSTAREHAAQCGGRVRAWKDTSLLVVRPCPDSPSLMQRTMMNDGALAADLEHHALLLLPNSARYDPS
jgi:hypothetical protein